MHINELVLKTFKKSLVTKEPKLNFELVNSKSCQIGIIIPKELCTQSVLSWINTIKLDLNSTFYKSWNDIVSKNRFELFIDQILHYSTTYGTGFEGIPYMKNEGIETPEIESFSVLESISIEELTKLICNTVYSGIALSSETLNDLSKIVKELNLEIDVDRVKNKEFLIKCCDELGKFPSNPVEMLRYLVYKMTDTTLLIKNKKLYNLISKSDKDVSIIMNSYNLSKFAEIFLRFKPLFLAIKHAHKNNTSVVNKIRRLSDIFHKKCVPGFFENLLSLDVLPQNIDLRLKDLSIFKLVTLYRACEIRLKFKDSAKLYKIRNGKVHLEFNTVKSVVAGELKFKVLSTIVEKLAKNKCKIKLPSNINLVMPSSEKDFMGDVPNGSFINISEKNHLIVGVHWKNDYNVRDIDLSCVDIDRNIKYGWNSSYRNSENSVIYSGDVTFAPGTELLYLKLDKASNYLFYINKFNGGEEWQFDIIVSNEECKHRTIKRNYMIDPNTILFNHHMTCKDSKNEVVIGSISNGKYIFMDWDNGKNSVSSNNINSEASSYIKDVLPNVHIELKELLELAGYEIVTDSPDIDLSIVNKINLINILS